MKYTALSKLITILIALKVINKLNAPSTPEQNLHINFLSLIIKDPIKYREEIKAVQDFRYSSLGGKYGI
jgi:hypothetical protein